MKPFLRKATLRRFTTFAITLIFLVTFFVSPAYADNAGPNLPTVGESLTGPGTAWTNPGNITAADGNAATASVLAGGGLTKYLRGTQFGFAIPAGSTIQGIKVEIYRRTTGNPNPQLRDYEVKLVKGGTIVGDNKADTTNDWPHASYEMATYGGPGDLWGASPWTADDINATDFGVVLAVRNQNPTNNKAAWVDYMRISVEYAPVDNPSLTLVKTATPTTYDSVGDVIGYSFLLTNSGNVTLSGPFTVTDDKAIDEACPATPSLAAGASITCTASYTITQADLDAGSVTNTAQGHGQYSAVPVHSNSDDETVTATQNAALTLAKTATPTTYDSVGDVIGYSFLLTNSGNVTLSGPFTVTDDKAIDEACPATGSLAPGASITCTASYTITQADLDAGSVTNTAQGHGSFNAAPVHSNSDDETVTATQNITLTLVKTATPSTYDSIGDVIGYSFLLTNNGNVTLSGPFTVTDDKAINEACPTIISLAPGASTTCTASYTITQADLDTGSVTNHAQGHGFFGAIPVDSNQDSETATATQNAVLTLVKAGTPATYDSVGDVIGYSFHLTNNGNVTLSGPFTVTDDKAINETCPPTASLAPGANVTCTASYTITQADLDAGLVTNTAQGHGFFNAAPVHSNSDDETVTATQNPALSLAKTATPVTYDSVDDVISYSFLLTNSGNVTLSGPFTVTDDKADDESCPATASLAPGASITCTASYTITQADLDAGSVTNNAQGHGSFNAAPVHSNSDSETVTASQNSDLTLAKTATPTTYDSVGDVISYSFLLTNNGSVTLSGPFTVTDDKATDEACPTVISLAPGASTTCAASYTITQADLDTGTVTNLAQGHGFFNAAAVHSNSDSETVTASQNPALTLVNTPTPPTYMSVGDVINYSFLLTNSGNVTLSGPFTVTDDKAIDEDCPATSSLAPGASITCTASYTIVMDDIIAGSVTNTATGSSFFEGNPVTSASDQATVNRVSTLLYLPAVFRDYTYNP